MPARINSVNESVDFSKITDSNKKEFCERVIADQLNFVNQLVGIPSYEHLILEHLTLIHLFKISNVKIVARRLSGIMNGSQIITEFLKVMDEMC